MYITYEEYTKLYDQIDEKAFNRNCRDACRLMDLYTTGIANFKKLEKAFPEDKTDADAVSFCAAKLTNTLYLIEQAQSAGGNVSTDQGVHSKVISSISSGNESISYATTADTDIDKAASDRAAKAAMVNQIIHECLSGVNDRNGIPLLYMGPYPRRYVC